MYQKIYKILKSQILEGNLEPGTRLIGEKLADQMGVSRTPIREAINHLAVENFVETIPGYGTVVNGISIKDLKEVLQVRGVLEGLAAKLAIENITKEEIEKLEKIIEDNVPQDRRVRRGCCRVKREWIIVLRKEI